MAPPTQQHPHHPPLPETDPQNDTVTPTPNTPNTTISIVAPPTASLSLSISSLLTLPTQQPQQHPQKTTTLTQHLKLKTLHHKITSLTLSPATTPKKPTSTNNNKSFTPTPLQIPLFITPRPPSDPTNGAAARRSTIVWFRNDLRVHDNECLTTAHSDSTSLLPVYVFDPRDYGKSSSGFDKTGPYRATFLLESVSDLRDSLRAKGSDLIVRIGAPEVVIGELARRVKADAVYAHREVSGEEGRVEERVEREMEKEGVEVRYFWGSTLYHLDDVPFKLEDMPSNYGGFRESVAGLSVRETIAALEKVRGLPVCGGSVEVGQIPSLADLGISTPASPQVIDCLDLISVYYSNVLVHCSE